MYLKLKKSQITDWWVSTDHKMDFCNILSGQPLEGNFLVVGYLNKSKKQLATSTNHVVRITHEGVITAKGTFYPFEEAHELYLQFLIDANKPNTKIAYSWNFVKTTSKEMIIIADIMDRNIIQKDVTFDFIQNQNTSTLLSGYSNQLSSNIVLSTFNKRNYCLILGIPDDIELDIYNSSFALHEKSNKRIETIKMIYIKIKKDLSPINVKIIRPKIIQLYK